MPIALNPPCLPSHASMHSRAILTVRYLDFVLGNLRNPQMPKEKPIWADGGQGNSHPFASQLESSVR